MFTDGSNGFVSYSSFTGAVTWISGITDRFSRGDLALGPALLRAGYQENDEVTITSDTGSATYRITELAPFGVSVSVSLSIVFNSDTGRPSYAMTFPHRIVGQDFTITRDADEVVVCLLYTSPSPRDS